jgi:hypothetical protein
MENERHGLQPIGSLLPRISSSPQPQASMDGQKQTSSGITGLPNPVRQGPSSTGMQRGAIGAVTASELRSMAQTATAEQVEMAVEASLRQLKELSRNFAAVAIIHPDYGYDEMLGINPDNIDKDEAFQALAIVNASLEPAHEELIIKELLKLGYKTKSRADEDGDARLRMMAYAEELGEFPPDVIRTACQKAARLNTFFPSVADLRELCQNAQKQRKRLKIDLERALRNG